MNPFIALEIKTSLVLNLVLANNIILQCFFFIFLIIDFYFLIFTIIMEILIFVAELVIPTGIPSKKARGEIETHPVTVEARIMNSQCNLKCCKPFCASYLLIHFAFFLHWNKLLFYLCLLI